MCLRWSNTRDHLNRNTTREGDALVAQFPMWYPEFLVSGAWRSPEAHLHGVQGVAGSNPAAPTIYR